MKKEPERISVHNGDVLLSCEFHRPDTIGPYPVIITVHGAGLPEKDSFINSHLVNLLIPEGIGVCCFDRRGSGESGGDFETADFYDLAGDVAAVMNTLHSRNDTGKIGLYGISQGGWVAPLAANLAPYTAFMVLVSSTPFSVSEQMNYSTEFFMQEKGCTPEEIASAIDLRNTVKEYFFGNISLQDLGTQIEQHRGNSWFDLSGIPPFEDIPEDPESTKWYQEIKFKPGEIINRIKIPTLLIYGETDPWIPIEKSIDYWLAESKAAQMELLTVKRIKGANHFMTKISDVGIRGGKGIIEAEYSSALVEWLNNRLQT